MQRKVFDFNLQYGDRQRIAEGLKCSAFTVYKVLNGERSHSTALGKRIVKAAELYQKTRQLTEVSIQKITEQ